MPDQLPSLEDLVSQIPGKKKGAAPAGEQTEADVTHTETAAPADLTGDTVLEDTTVVAPTKPATDEVPAESPAKKDPTAAKFAAIARREREVRQREAQAEQKAREQEARLQEMERRIQEREQRIAGAKRPIDILKAHGLTYQDVTEDVLGSYNAPEPDPVDQKLQERLSPIDEKTKAFEEKFQKMQEQIEAINQERVRLAERELQLNIRHAAKENGCELIQEMGDEAYNLVREVLAASYEQSGAVLTFNEACARVEKYYEERAAKLAATKKMQSRFAPPPATAPQKAPSRQAKSQTPVSANTLTQSLNQGSRAKPNIDSMSKAEALDWMISQMPFKS